MLPTVIGYSMARIPSITLQRRTGTCRRWWMIAISCIFFVLASVLGIVNDQYLLSNNDVKMLRVLKIFITFMHSFNPYIFLTISSFLLVSWTSVLNDEILRIHDSSSESVDISRCLELYTKFKKSFGLLFLMLFSSSSFVTIVTIFFSVSSCMCISVFLSLSTSPSLGNPVTILLRFFGCL